MPLRHIVLFRFKPETTDQQVADLAAGLSGLPGAIPQIRSYRHGPDAGLLPASWDYALIAEFDSPEDLMTYRTHPAHVRVVEELVEPISTERAAVQLTI